MMRVAGHAPAGGVTPPKAGSGGRMIGDRLPAETASAEVAEGATSLSPPEH
jgi:hypothetical protein